MKFIRSIQQKEHFRFLLPALAVIFVLALSFHNHSLAGSNSLGIDSDNSVNHSTEKCSACLLQGNLQLPEAVHSTKSFNLGPVIAVVKTEYIVPRSFISSGRPSRAPPIA